MPPSDAPLSQAEWTQRLEPAFATSMRAVHEKITSESHVQRWLQRASFEAAQGLTAENHLQAEAEAHSRLLDDLTDTFPALVEAVTELTDGCGTLDLRWRPLNPNYSRIEVDFGRSFDIDVFYRCDTLDDDALQNALKRVHAALPESDPFPNRPQTATGLIAHDGDAVGFRWHKRLNDDGQPWLTGTILPASGETIDNIRPGAAPKALKEALAQAG